MFTVRFELSSYGNIIRVNFPIQIVNTQVSIQYRRTIYEINIGKGDRMKQLELYGNCHICAMLKGVN